MPHFICRWPGGDVLLASVESRRELDTILQERCEPGVCKVARYHGPLVLELKPDMPGVSRASAERFRPGPACPSFEPAWQTRAASGDVELLAVDGSSQRVHKLVLQCRLPVLQGRPIAAGVTQVRLACVPDGPCLHSLVQYMYLDNVQQQADLTPQLHCVALSCGLQRLVELCEAHFAQQLELQLVSWQGLCESRRGAVLDSFIGWTLYCEQLDRQELRQLCVHALARHVTAAQSRPSWPSLSKATSSLVQLIAASTAPPLIHRQLVPDGSAVLPVPSDAAPAAAAAGPVVSVDAEAFAAAGGRLTSSEWQQLQKFRDAVSGSLKAQEASPIVLEQQHLASSGLAAAANPHVAFTVKQPVLGPHKRLMDSVCRFAFPATHSLLGSGWHLTPAAAAAPAGAQQPAAASAAQPAAAQPAAAPSSAASPAAAPSSAASPATAGVQQAAVTAAAAANRHQPTAAGQSSGPMGLSVPVPVPDVRPLLASIAASAAEAETAVWPDRSESQAAHAAGVAPGLAAAVSALAAEEAAEPSSSSTQHALSGQAGVLLAEQSSIRTSGTGSAAGPAAAAAAATAGPSQAGNNNSSPSVARILRSRINSASAGSPGRRPSHGRLRSELRPSWGSGVSLSGADALAVTNQAAEQQQQPMGIAVAGLHGAAMPLQLLRLLQAEEQSGSWGSGTISRQSSLPPLQLPGAAIDLEVGQQQQQHRRQEQPMMPRALLSQLSPGELEARLAQQGHHNQQNSRGGSEQSAVEAAVDELGAGIAANVQQQWYHHLLGVEQEAGTTHEFVRQGLLGGHSTRLLDLPAFKVPLPAPVSRSEHASSAAGTAPGTAPGMNNSGCPGAPAATVTAAAAGAGSAAAAPAAAGAAERPASLTAAARHTSGSNNIGAIEALQRALVEDFVLYEEASAARQHVVGILMSIEQGDAAAGQRLLAPACAELVAATAPAAVPNRLTLPAAAAGAAAGDEAAVKAAGEYLKSAQGISKLLGMASSSRAAMEPSQEQVQRRQQQLMRALQRIGHHLPRLTRLLNTHHLAAADGSTAEHMLMQLGLQETMQAGGQQHLEEQQHAAEASGDGELDLASALPELVQSLQLPVLLTQEQYNRRQLQLQQIASHAAAVLGADGSNSAGSSDGAAAAQAVALPPPPLAAAHGRMAGQAGPGAASAPTGGARDIQAGLLFSSILASLGSAAAGRGADPLGVGTAGAGPAGMRAPAAADHGQDVAAGSGAAGGQQAGAAGAPGTFTPTGVGAMLAGGLLAEGGVAGDSILEDMAADMLLHGAGGRRITCHGLYELCAALARPADHNAANSSPQPTQQQHATGLQQDEGNVEVPHAPGGSSAGDGSSGPVALTGRKRRLSGEVQAGPSPKR